MHTTFGLLALAAVCNAAAIAQTVSTDSVDASSTAPLNITGLVPKQLNAIRRRPGLTHKEYENYHVLVHGAKSWAAPVDARPQVYVQDHIFDGVFGTNTTAIEPSWFGRDDLTELYCNNITQFQASASSPYVAQVIGPDGANFNDFPTAVSMFAYEVFVSSPAITPNAKSAPTQDATYFKFPGTVTAFYWLSATGASQTFNNNTFAYNVNNAFQKQLLALAPSAAYNASVHIPITGTDSRAYYGGAATPPMSAVIKLWLTNSQSAVDSVRAAQKAIQGMTTLGVDFDNSFMVFAREVTLWNLNKAVVYDKTRLSNILAIEAIA